MFISVSRADIDNTINKLADTFKLKNLGSTTKFLGITIKRNAHGIHINQQGKIEKLCEDMGMNHCNFANTPISDDNFIDRDIEVV